MLFDPAHGGGLDGVLHGFLHDGKSEYWRTRFWYEFNYPTDKADIPPLPIEDPRYRYINWDHQWALNAYIAQYVNWDQQWSLGILVNFDAISDSLPLADSLSMPMEVTMAPANDTLPLSDTGQYTFQRITFLTLANDTLPLNDTLSLGLTLVFSHIEDSLFFQDTTEFPEGTGYEGWAVNASTGATSRYEWAQGLTSFVEHEGKFYAAAADGLYELAGSTDEGTAIEALGVLGQTDFDVPGEKRVRSGYLGARTDGTLFIRVVLDDNEVYEYTVDESEIQEMQSRRALFGRGLRGVYWQLAFGNVDGASMEVKTLRLTPVEYKRRLK